MWVWFPEGPEGMVGTLRRATVQKTDDSGTQQILKKMTGLKSEIFEDVYRPQPHGFSSHAPAGSEGLFLALGGRSDRLVALGFEHKDKRPKNLPEGGTCIYDADGNVVRVVKDDLQIKHSQKIVLAVGSNASVTIEDGKITLDASDILLKGNVDLGGTGGLPVDRTDNNPSSKVKAI